MSTDASAGRISVDVVSDTTGFAAALKAKIDAETAKIKARVILQVEANTAKAQAALERVSRTRTARVTVTANTTRANTAINTAARTRKATIEVDADGLKAAAEIDAIARDRTVTIKARADTADAEAKIRDVEDRTNGGGEPASTTLSNNLGSILIKASKIPAIAGGIDLLVQSVGDLAGGLFSLAAAGSQALGVLGALPNLVGVGVQGIATLVLGFSGISGAVKALDQAQTQASASAGTAARAQQAAADRVADAQERVKEAVQDADDTVTRGAQRIQEAQDQVAQTVAQAAARVTSAEKSLASAQAAAREAQQALNEARAEAVDRLEDMQLSLKRAALDEEAAQLAVIRARQNLNKADTSATSTDLDRKEANLAYREALQSLDEVKQREKELQEQADKTSKSGVEGDQQVIAAKKQLSAAQQQEIDAAQAVRDAQVQGAQEIAKAQRQLAQTQQEVSRQDANAARNVAVAQRDLGRALRDQQQAQQSNTAATTRAAAALAALGPAGQKFAKFVQGTLEPRFKTLRAAVQGALLPPLQDAVTKAMPFIDTLQAGLVDTGHRVGGIAEQFAALVASPAFRADTAKIMASNNRAMSLFGDAGVHLADALTKVMVASGPLLERFAAWVDRLSKAADKTAKEGEQTGKLTAFFKKAGDTAAQLGRIIGNVAKAIFGLGKTAAPAGRDLLDSLEKTTKGWSDALKDPAVQNRLAATFKSISDQVKQIGTVLADAVALVARFSTDGGSSLRIFLGALDTVFKALNALLTIPGFGEFVHLLLLVAGTAGGLGLAAGAMLKMSKNIGEAVKGGKKLLDSLTDSEGAARKLGTRLGSVTKGGVTGFGRAAKSVGSLVSTIGKVAAVALIASARFVAMGAAAAASAVGTAIATAATAAWSVAMGVLDAVMDANPIILVAAAVALFVAGIIVAYKTSATFRAIVQAAFDGVKKAITDSLGIAYRYIRDIFNIIKTIFSTDFGIFRSIVQGIMALMRGDISGAMDHFKQAFQIGIDGIKKIWNSLKDAALTPVRFVVNVVYDDGIRSLWNTVSGIFHGPKLPHFRLATGGVIPGYSPGRDTVPALLSPGEGVLVPEAVRGLGGAPAIHAINSAYTSRVPAPAGSNRFIGGGIVSAVSAGIHKLTSGVRGALAGPFRAAVAPLKAELNSTLGSSGIGGLINGLSQKMINDLIAVVAGQDKDDQKVAASQAGNVSGSVARWAALVTQVLGELGQPSSMTPWVLQLISHESGGNPFAINLTDCVPLTTVILTKRGWLKHSDVAVGDETIGYNMATGRSEWTRITRVVHYEDAPLVRMGNSRWHATVTPNHRWLNLPRVYVPKEELPDKCPMCDWPDPPPPPAPLSECPECGWKPKAPGGVALHRSRKHGVLGAKARGVEKLRRRGRTTQGGLRIHLAKMHGVRAEPVQYETSTTATFITTRDIGIRDRILVAAPAETASSLDVTVQEAAILGWIAGDGHVETRKHKPTISIGQSKPEMVAKLETLLADVPHAHYAYDVKQTRMGNKPCGPSHHFRLDYQFAQDLMRRAGNPKTDAFRQVLAMSAEQREAWLQAMIDAEGNRTTRPGYTKPQVTISQTYGTIHDAIVLAVYLHGCRPRLYDNKVDTPGWAPSGTVKMNNPIITGDFLELEDAGSGPVWCVTTELGTWTAEEDGHVFLTGNSNAQRGDPSRGLTQTIGSTFNAYAGKYQNAGIYDPHANIYAGLNYGIHRYGSVASIPGIASLMRGGPYKPYSRGGVVPGVPSGRDSVPALLAPGEGVLTRDAVAAIGGSATIDALNAAGPAGLFRASRDSGGGALVGVGASRTGTVIEPGAITMTVNNPAPETPSQTVNNRLRALGQMGLFDSRAH